MVSIRWQDARKECSFCSMRERRAEAQGCITQERQRQSGSGRALLCTRATCISVGTSQGILVQGFRSRDLAPKVTQV